MKDYLIDRLIDFSDLLNVKELSPSDVENNVAVSIKATVDEEKWNTSFTAPEIAPSLGAETNQRLNMIKLDDEAVEYSTSNLFGADSLQPIHYEVRLTTSSGITRKKTFRKIWMSKEVHRRCISEKECEYEVFDSDRASKEYLVITLGGSGGGFDFSRQMACLLANHGYTSAALAYFGVGDLPSQLDRIPLEYFQRAWLNMEKLLSNRKRKIVLIGRSRGAELALLLASHFPEVSAVIAFAPSDVVWGGFAPGHSAWTLNKREIPFIPFDGKKFESLIANGAKDTAIDMTKYYDQCRAVYSPPEVEIAVENIGGDVLLFSGEDDRLWPSSNSARKIENRLNEKDFVHEFEHYSFDRVGHCFDIPGLPFFTEDQFLNYEGRMLSFGGQEVETIRAERASFEAILGFLKRK